MRGEPVWLYEERTSELSRNLHTGSLRMHSMQTEHNNNNGYDDDDNKINNNLDLTGMKLQEATENSIIRSFIMCTVHQIILRRSHQEG
jgi:hypothetical protein